MREAATVTKVEKIYILTHFTGWSLHLNENGEYTNIVIKVEDDIPENSCESLLNNLKVTNKHNKNKQTRVPVLTMAS